MKKKKKVILRRKGSVFIIEINGDLSHSIEDDFLATYSEACASHPQNIIIKFDFDGHIYSSGLTVLARLIGEAERKGQKLYATGLSEHFTEVFEFTKLTKYIPLFPSEEEALVALK